jgi:hypothetical protein
MLAAGFRRLSDWSSSLIHPLCVRHLGARPSKIVKSKSQYIRGKSREPRRQCAGAGGAIFAGMLLIIGAGLWRLQGLAGIVKGTSSYIESANDWITTSASTWIWIHRVGGIVGPAAGFGVFFWSGVGALAGDPDRHHLGVRELHVHSVPALVGLNDHLHRPVG